MSAMTGHIKQEHRYEMSKEELRQCPFCGETRTYWTHSGEYAHIFCGECNARGPEEYNEEEFGDKAYQLWDTRPLEDALAAERDAALARVERLEAALQPLAALWRDGMERDPDSKTLWDHPDITVGDIRRARRELGEE